MLPWQMHYSRYFERLKKEEATRLKSHLRVGIGVRLGWKAYQSIAANHGWLLTCATPLTDPSPEPRRSCGRFESSPDKIESAADETLWFSCGAFERRARAIEVVRQSLSSEKKWPDTFVVSLSFLPGTRDRPFESSTTARAYPRARMAFWQRASRIGACRASTNRLQENGSFFEFFLCLSRAGLGKMSIFI